MNASQDLLQAVSANLGPAVGINLSDASAPSDVFEAYVFSLVIQAARREGATVTYQTVTGSTPQQFIFRTSPGHIYSTAQEYTHAVISFPQKPTLEAHVGVRFSGRSGVLHECDVAVLFQQEAATCRAGQVPPRSEKLLLALECKFYSTPLKLDLARSFIGLESDMSTGRLRQCHFVSNTSSESVQRLLAKQGRHWERDINPHSQTAVERLRNLIQHSFVNFKAAH